MNGVLVILLNDNGRATLSLELRDGDVRPRNILEYIYMYIGVYMEYWIGVLPPIYRDHPTYVTVVSS